MTENSADNSPLWKKPDEVMQLHRLKRRKKALQERMKQPAAQSCPDLSQAFSNKDTLNFSRLFNGKRKNPFSKNSIEQENKKFCDPRGSNNTTLDESSDSTLFQLLALSNSEISTAKQLTGDVKLSSFTSLLNKITQEQNYSEPEQPHISGKRRIPIDWSLKTKVRFMSPKPFAWNQKLKASEEASGITGFVRCLDTTNSCTLDTSHHSRFHQNCLYWQHPSLPWLTLFPRNTGKVATKSFVASNEEIKESLHKEWTESFRSLFQLVRARQCPYFYVCANTFTCLFQAAGISGQMETSAYISPTTRGLRQTLKQEEIEFSMPLRKNYAKRKSGESNSVSTNGEDKNDGDGPKNSSFDSCYDTMDTTINGHSPTANNDVNFQPNDDASGDEDEMESDQWLQSLGVAEDEIKKINYSQIRKKQVVESMVDSGEESLIFVRGIDAQALFNFLLNCKSSIPATGPFGGIPPTLLAPTAFQGGALQPLKVRESIVHADGGKYYSVELRGPILPTTVHSLCHLLQSNFNSFSGTFANMQHSIAFTKAARVLADGEKTTENIANKVSNVFGTENLSDCGLNHNMLERFCSSDPSSMEIIDSWTYNEDNHLCTRS